MAWVTKSSDEQYTPAPPPRQYTRKEKAANWWHYYKIPVIVVAVVAACIAWVIHDMLSQVQPDLRVAYVGEQMLPTETTTALETALEGYCTDLNGDGQVVVQLMQYNVNLEEGTDSADPYNQMAGMTKLNADLSTTTEMYLYLLEDPADFQAQFQVLQNRDGTLPPDGQTGDWQQMVYRWSDCPVLTGLDLGNYTLFGSTEDQQFPSQELLAPLYLACRGNWDAEAPEAYTASLELWQALTAGAVPPAEE